MAKQSGIHGLRGKVNGMSYYGSKNGGALVRKINEGMSSRVKTAKEYVNTRKNNAEFGMCGDFAGVFIGTISQRWRFVLNSIATGLMVKAMKEQLNQDSASDWGKRYIPAESFPILQSVFNGLSKNEMPAVIKDAFDSILKYNNTSGKLVASSDIEIDSELAALLESIGATGFYLDIYHLAIETPHFDTESMSYTKATASFTRLTSFSPRIDGVSVNTPIIDNATEETCRDFAQDDPTQMPQAFVLFRPYRKIGSDYAVLQQHCAGAVYVPGETE